MLAWNTQLYASWVTVTASYAWFPLVLAGGILLLRFPGKACGILVFSIAAGLLALASPSQAVIHAALSCLILFAAGIGWMCLQRQFADVWHLTWSLGLCGVIAFGLAGAAILPMYLATGEMIRHVGAGGTVIGHAQIPWKSFNLYQLSPSQAAGIIIRPTWISIVGSPYVGPLGVIGALLAAIYFRRLDSFLRMLVLGFGTIGLYGLLSAFGTNLGLAYVNFHLPLIGRFREAGRHLVLFVIGISFLSGIGYCLLAQYLEQYKEHRNARPLVAPAILALVFAGIILWELVWNGQGRSLTSFWMLALAPILLILGRITNISRYSRVASAGLLVSLAALVVPVRGLSASRSDFNKPINLLSHRVLQQVAGESGVRDYRVDYRDSAFDNKFWAMNGSYYGIKSFYNQLTPQPYAQFRFMLLASVPHLRAMMGARYVLCGSGNSPPDPNARQISEIEGYRLYENPAPMGRLTLVHRVAGRVNDQGAFVKVIGKGFDYLSEAYVTSRDFKKVEAFLHDSQPLPPGREHISRIVDQPNRSYCTVECASASLLVLNEWFTPAWKARVNGKQQPVLRVNQWQAAVLLPAGENRVEFEYRPTLFRVLMALNRVTVVLLLLYAAIAIIRLARAVWRRHSLSRATLVGNGHTESNCPE